MKYKNLLHKAFAAVLAIATTATSLQSAVPSAYAAVSPPSGNYVRFVNNVNKEYLQQDTILEGVSVPTVYKMPNGYNMTNYVVVGDGANDNVILVNPSGSAQAITPNVGVLDNKGWGTSKTFTLRPVFNVYLTDGDGIISFPTQSDGTTPRYTFGVKLLQSASVTDNFTLSFKTVGDQDADTSSITALTDVVGSGYFEKYTGGVAVITPTGKKGEYTLTLNPDGTDVGTETCSMTITCNGTVPTIPANTKFDLTFRVQRGDELQATVITRRGAVDTIAYAIANIEAELNNFIRFSGNDTKNGISENNFRVRHIEKRYNYGDGFKINWEWETTTPGAENLPQILEIKNEEANAEWWDVYVRNRPEANVEGVLKATVVFDNGTAIKSDDVMAEGAVNVTVIGSGLPARFEPLTTTTGSYDILTSTQKDLPPQDIINSATPSQLDVYNGSAPDWVDPVLPYKFSARLDFGTGVQEAAYARIYTTSDGGGELGIYLNSTALGEQYRENDPINKVNRFQEISFRALHKGTVYLNITFYNERGVMIKRESRLTISIQDTSPSPDATMKNVKMIGSPADGSTQEDLDRFNQIYNQGNVGVTGFSPEVRDYQVTLSNIVDKITLAPTYNYQGLITHLEKRPVTITVQPEGGALQTFTVDGTGSAVEYDNATKKGGTTPQITLQEEIPTTITIMGLAENKDIATYTIVVTRRAKGNNTNLQALSFIPTDDGEERILDFDPEKFSYEVSLPYAYRGSKKATVSATTEDPWAQVPEITTDPETTENIWESIVGLFNRSQRKVDLAYVEDPITGEISNRTIVTVKITSEDGVYSAEYKIYVTIEEPSRNNKVGDLDVFRITSEGEELLGFANNTQFNADERHFYLSIPYSTDRLRLEILPQDEKAQAVKVIHPAVYPLDGGVTEQIKSYRTKGEALEFPVGTATSDPVLDAQMEFDYEIYAQAESDEWTEKPYYLHVTRSEPDTESLLSGLTVTNVEDNKPVDTFSFSPLKEVFDFEVPFTTSEVLVSPVAKSALAEVTVNGKVITASYTGVAVKLEAGAITRVSVVVLPEGGTQYQRTYTLNITRAAPSSEARLASLVANGAENMQPTPFIPAVTSYTVDIPKGTESFTLTAMPVDPNATVTIDGKAVENGQASPPLTTYEGYATILIEVTAQDGRTKKTYYVQVRNYNLIEKSTDATLQSLWADYGDVAPQFTPNIEEYELYVKPTAMKLSVTPVLSSPTATMVVKADSRVLDPLEGVYSSSLLKDKTTFTIEVTAEDGVTKKTYTLNVFRNDEEKQGDLKPITAEVVDFEMENPIVIDITTYAVIDASVFNTLKTDYPEKTILFKGNDYTLSIKGEDVSGLVPYTQLYDLYFSFSTPEEQVIRETIAGSGQWDIDPVYFYFDGHGALPGPMTLTVSLGRAYSNRQLFWNYYNSERERIDYYGYVMSNAKGSFSVPLTHLSTYLVTDRKIRIAENKVGLDFGGAEAGTDTSGMGGGSENISGDGTNGKPIPNTGVIE